MGRQYVFATASEALPAILKDLLESGTENNSRNGRVKEHLNAQIVLRDPVRREILTPGRKANVFAQIAETVWVLSGQDDARWLSAYLPRAMNYSDDGKTWRGAYGPRIRNHRGVDQLAYVVDTLKRDPLSRQAVIQIYDAQIDSTPGLDRPCNTFLQFQSRLGQLHMTVSVRSNDIMWGWSGINAFEWSTMQEIVASLLGIQVGTLTFNIGSLHLYDWHWKKAAGIVEASNFGGQRGWPRPQVYLPHAPVPPLRSIADLDSLLNHWMQWEAACRRGDYLEKPRFKGNLFPAWEAAIAYYWTREEVWLKHLEGTALAAAIREVPEGLYPALLRPSQLAPVPSAAPRLSEPLRAFYKAVSELHATKHASYGDSWKKRGEKLSILANIARKVDRLGVTDEFETSSDTAIDLLVYLIKYRCWLSGQDDGPQGVNPHLEMVLGVTEDIGPEDDWEGVREMFDHYADCVDDLTLPMKAGAVEELITRVAPMARDLWLNENGPFDAPS